MSWSTGPTTTASLSRLPSRYLRLRISSQILGGLPILFALGCTKGSPEISAVVDLPPIILDSYRYESKQLQYFDIGLNGRVVRHVDRLEVSLDDGATWETLTNEGASSLNINLASCAENCAFSYALPDIGSRWPVLMSMAVNEEKRALLRGQSLFGVTAPTAFTIKRLKAGFFSVGAFGLNQLGGKARKTASGLTVKSGRLEAIGGREVVQ